MSMKSQSRTFYAADSKDNLPLCEFENLLNLWASTVSSIKKGTAIEIQAPRVPTGSNDVLCVQPHAKAWS